MWRSGNLELNGVQYIFEIELSERPSKVGIFGGKIIELRIFNPDDQVIAEYNRKWIVSPEKGSTAYQLVKVIAKEYNFKKERTV